MAFCGSLYFFNFISVFTYSSEGFLEMPNNNAWSQLQMCYLKKLNDRGKLVTYPKSVAWYISGVGITFAEVLSFVPINLSMNVVFYIS